MASTAVAQPSTVTFVSKISPQESRDLEKFVKFLALKMTQVIVQSRLGEKIKTQCKSMPSSSDWFSLAVQDIPEVSHETKKALGGAIPLISSSPLCVEISLRTNEGDSLVLELWTLQAVNLSFEASSRIMYTVYSKMGLLLKSIISISRVTPAYRLSRKQNAESFVICYRVFMGDPSDSALGEGVQSCHVGQIETPIGAYRVNVKYRTQLTLMPRNGNSERNPMMVKSDHFTPEFSPRLCRATENQGGSSSSEQAATSDESQDAFNTFVNTPPTPSALRTEQRFSFDNGPRFGAFAEPPNGSRPKALANEFVLPELPLPSFAREKSREKLEKNLEENVKKEESNRNNNTKTLRSSEESVMKRSSSSLGQPNEDFVMVELKTPFAESDSSQDIGAFFRECQAAPPSLPSFTSQLPQLQSFDLGAQLQRFETQLKDYDDLVKSLHIGEDNDV